MVLLKKKKKQDLLKLHVRDNIVLKVGNLRKIVYGL